MRLIKGRYLISAALILMIITAAAYAVSKNQISYVENFETDRVSIDLQGITVLETGESAEADGIVEANKDISYIPRITNRDAACYVRARVEITTDNENSEPLGTECIYGMNEDWIRKGEYFYYTKMMSEGQTVDVFKGIHLPENWTPADAGELKLSVTTEAVQGKNFNPDFSESLPWGAVKLNAVAKAEHLRVGEVIPVQSISELNFASEGGFEYSTSDLFDSFKDMMPGDAFEKTVIVKNDSRGTLQTYLEATSTEDLLSEALHLQITCGDTEIYSGTLSGVAAKDKFKLAKLPRGEKYELKFVLGLPTGSDNKVASLNDSLTWTLTAEEQPDTSAQTSDWRHDAPLAAAVLAGAVIMFTLFFRRRGQA